MEGLSFFASTSHPLKSLRPFLPFCLTLLLLIPTTINVEASDDVTTYTVTLNPSYDGFVRHYGSSDTNYPVFDSYDYVLSEQDLYNAEWSWRGFVEFDLSCIPNNAVVTKTSISYYSFDYRQYSSQETYITKMDYRPSITDNQTIYSDVKSKPYYLTQSCASYGTGYHTIIDSDWIINPSNNVTDSLDRDWFAIGLYSPEPKHGRVNFSSMENPTYGGIKLTIEYQCTFPSPETLNPVYGEWKDTTINTLEWSLVEGTNVCYEVRYGTDTNNLDNIVNTSNLFVDTISYPFNSTVYWKVRAYENITNPIPRESYWSEISKFFVGDLAIPTPTLVSPIDNTYFGDIQNQIVWSPVWGRSVKYVYNWNYGQDETTSTSALLTGINNDDVITWKVKAYEDAESSRESAWSEEWSFSIGAGSIDTPVLVSPSNNIFIQSTTNTLSWQSVTGNNVFYTLQYGFNLENEVVLTTTTYSVTYDIDDLVKWRVKAWENLTNGLESGWSDTWSFFIGVDYFEAPVIISPTTGEYNTTSLLIEWSWPYDFGINLRYEVENCGMTSNKNITATFDYWETRTIRVKVYEASYPFRESDWSNPITVWIVPEEFTFEIIDDGTQLELWLEGTDSHVGAVRNKGSGFLVNDEHQYWKDTFLVSWHNVSTVSDIVGLKFNGTFKTSHFEIGGIAQFLVKIDNENYYSPEFAVTSLYEFREISYIFEQNPVTGVNWNWADFEDIEVGVAIMPDAWGVQIKCDYLECELLRFELPEEPEPEPENKTANGYFNTPNQVYLNDTFNCSFNINTWDLNITGFTVRQLLWNESILELVNWTIGDVWGTDMIELGNLLPGNLTYLMAVNLAGIAGDNTAINFTFKAKGVGHTELAIPSFINFGQAKGQPAFEIGVGDNCTWSPAWLTVTYENGSIDVLPIPIDPDNDTSPSDNETDDGNASNNNNTTPSGGSSGGGGGGGSSNYIPPLEEPIEPVVNETINETVVPEVNETLNETLPTQNETINATDFPELLDENKFIVSITTESPSDDYVYQIIGLPILIVVVLGLLIVTFFDKNMKRKRRKKK